MFLVSQLFQFLQMLEILPWPRWTLQHCLMDWTEQEVKEYVTVMFQAQQIRFRLLLSMYKGIWL